MLWHETMIWTNDFGNVRRYLGEPRIEYFDENTW